MYDMLIKAKSGRGLKEQYGMIAAASESDNKEAGYWRVNCVGLFPLDTGKDWTFANVSQYSIIRNLNIDSMVVAQVSMEKRSSILDMGSEMPGSIPGCCIYIRKGIETICSVPETHKNKA